MKILYLMQKNSYGVRKYHLLASFVSQVELVTVLTLHVYTDLELPPNLATNLLFPEHHSKREYGDLQRKDDASAFNTSHLQNTLVADVKF